MKSSQITANQVIIIFFAIGVCASICTLYRDYSTMLIVIKTCIFKSFYSALIAILYCKTSVGFNIVLINKLNRVC